MLSRPNNKLFLKVNANANGRRREYRKGRCSAIPKRRVFGRIAKSVSRGGPGPGPAQAGVSRPVHEGGQWPPRFLTPERRPFYFRLFAQYVSSKLRPSATNERASVLRSVGKIRKLATARLNERSFQPG